MKNRYYFTLRYDDGGGWVEVFAMSRGQARRLYKTYGLTSSYCEDYDEDEFACTIMCKEGNFGRRCREKITFQDGGTVDIVEFEED